MRRTLKLPFLLLLVSIASFVSGCDRIPELLPPAPSPPTAEPATPQPTPIPPPPIQVAEITFRVTIPEDTPSDGPIQLSILDEVTGLALNPVHHTMQAETPNIYTITLQLKVGGVIKYRYTRGADVLAAEHTSDGRPVRYRLLKVTASGAVHDIVTRWNDTAYDGPTGRIMGQIRDSRDGDPLPNILVTIGGQQTLTRWDGTYLVEGLPPGTHNLVAYAMDGSHSTFQQGAVIATQSTTPAEFQVAPADPVNVTFSVTVPEGSIPAAPLRIAGNLHQLGNVFADLSGGISTPAARLPMMAYHPEGFYLLTMQLPAGAFVRYKYTLGDGFWNMETGEAGEPVVREFIVPEQETLLDDQIANWGSAAGIEPAWFSIQSPADTPEGDSIWLQLNPWGWTEPLPIWRTSANEWVYLLSSPLHAVAEVQFRYCRNAQCDTAPEIAAESGRTFTPGENFSVLEQGISGWTGNPGLDPGQVPSAEGTTPRPASFVRGYQLVPRYHPSWLPLTGRGFPDLIAQGADTVVLSPTWTFTRLAPPVFQVVPGTDAPWLDIVDLSAAASAAGLSVAMHPQPNFSAGQQAFWQEAPRDFAWWNNWFEQYGHFALHHAGLASRAGVETLVLGGEWVAPALPNGDMPDGFTSGVPAEAEAWWPDLLTEVRQVFNGQVAWALPFPGGLERPPEFIEDVDMIYLVWQTPLAGTPDAGIGEMREQAGELLDSQALPFFLRYNKPIVLLAAFPSADGAIQGCREAEDGACQPLGDLDLQEQSDAYQALLEAVNDRDWIAGFLAGGYYPPVATVDRSESTHGKPAGEVLENWFLGWQTP